MKSVKKFVGGEPVMSAAVAGVLADLSTQLAGDGLDVYEVARLFATLALGFIARHFVKPTATA